jgi:hypothetical protein
MVARAEPDPILAPEPQVVSESLSEAFLRRVFESVEGVEGFATSTTAGATTVYIVVPEAQKDAAIRAFLFVRRQLGDYTMHLLALTPEEADQLQLSESAHYFQL